MASASSLMHVHDIGSTEMLEVCRLVTKQLRSDLPKSRLAPNVMCASHDTKVGKRYLSSVHPVDDKLLTINVNCCTTLHSTPRVDLSVSS